MLIPPFVTCQKKLRRETFQHLTMVTLTTRVQTTSCPTRHILNRALPQVLVPPPLVSLQTKLKLSGKVKNRKADLFVFVSVHHFGCHSTTRAFFAQIECEWCKNRMNFLHCALPSLLHLSSSPNPRSDVLILFLLTFTGSVLLRETQKCDESVNRLV